jgi:hypothetical protein
MTSEAHRHGARVVRVIGRLELRLDRFTALLERSVKVWLRWLERSRRLLGGLRGLVSLMVRRLPGRRGWRGHPVFRSFEWVPVTVSRLHRGLLGSGATTTAIVLVILRLVRARGGATQCDGDQAISFAAGWASRRT